MRYIVDAHPLIWFLQQDKRLGANAYQILSNAQSELVLPATAYGEICWIVEHGRTNIPSVNVLQAVLEDDRRFTIYPMDQDVIDTSQHLTAITEMHDRQIVATALILIRRGEEVVLITRDENITSSGLVAILW